MLISDFSEPSQIFYADESRLSAFKRNQTKASMRTISIKVPSANLTEENICILDNLTSAFGRQVDRFLQLLNMVEFRRYAIGDRYRKLRDRIVANPKAFEETLVKIAEGKRSKAHRERNECIARQKGGTYQLPKVEPIYPVPLQSHHRITALQQAAGTMERWWRLIQVEAMSYIRSRKAWDELNDVERHYIAKIMCALSDEFFDVLDHKVPFLKIDNVTQIKCARGLCQLILYAVNDVRGRAPRRDTYRSVWYDVICYTSTYYAYKDETKVSLTTQVPGKLLDLWIPGKFPAREFIVEKEPAKETKTETESAPESEKAQEKAQEKDQKKKTKEKEKKDEKEKRVKVMRPKKPTIQTVKTDTGWEIHVAIPCKTPEIKLDPSVRRVSHHHLNAPVKAVPSRAAIPSDWFDASQYESTYSMTKKKTVLSFLGGKANGGFELVVEGALPIVDRRASKDGKVTDMKQKHKPAICINRGRKGVTGIAILGDPQSLQQTVLQNSKNLLRLFRTDILSLEGEAGLDSHHTTSCWFDDCAYKVFFDEKTQTTFVTVSRPRNGLRFTVELKGHQPLREFIKDANGIETKLSQPKKPTFRIVTSESKAQLEILLPVKPHDEAPQSAIVVSRTRVVEHTGSYLDRVKVSHWFAPKEYLASFDDKTKQTHITFTPENGKPPFTVTVEGYAPFISRFVRVDGTEKIISVKENHYLSFEYVGHDDEGRRMVDIVMARACGVQSSEYLKPDEALTDPNTIRVMGFDFGFTEVAYDALGNSFGSKLGTIIKRFVDYLTRTLRVHNHFRSLVHKYSANGASPNPRKVRNILRYNLGQKTFNQRKASLKTQIKDEVNRALNEMLALHKGAVFVVEVFSKMFRMNGVSRYWRRLLSSWVRGTLVERLEFKAALAGVRLVYMPTSYSSQVCNVCGDRARANRHGNDYHCRSCGATAHADAKAAEQLLLRFHDPRFHRFVSMKDIRAIHQQDHQAYLAKVMTRKI